jgi:hypothetical protein
MRPVVQVAVVRAVRHVGQQGLLTWDEAMAKLKSLDWRISSAPFIAVWQLTPDARAQGKMAMRTYRQLRGSRYPVPIDELVGNIVAASAMTQPMRRARLIRSPTPTPTNPMMTCTDEATSRTAPSSATA